MRDNDFHGDLAGTRICMVVYSYYPQDQRVRREAEVLQEKGANIHVICLRKKDETGYEVRNSISVYRLPMRIKRDMNHFAYFLRYIIFLFLSTLLLAGLYIKYRYKVVHVHSLPDYLVFCTLVPKIFGALVVLDLHELMPEIYAAKFDASMDSNSVNVAKVLEKISVRYSDFIFTTSPARKETLEKRTGKKEMSVIMNLPKRDVYKSRDMRAFMEQNGLVEAFTLIYVGGLYRERELDVVVKAVKYIEERIPNIAFILCGAGEDDYVSLLKNLIRDLNIERKVFFLGFIPQHDILNYVELSNVTLCPYRYYPKLGEVLDGVSSTKIFEYLMIPKPVIVSGYSATRKEFEDLVLFYKSGDHKHLGEKIFDVYKNEEKYKRMAQRASEVLFKRYDPEGNKQKFVEIYKRFMTR